MQDEFQNRIRESAADAGTVFLSSHELDEVQQLADRVAIIKDGNSAISAGLHSPPADQLRH
jgi:ABC-2 type transport system ATP-binding protein